MALSASADLRHDSVGRLIVKLAVPAIAAQMINALYNMVDRMYIGRLPGEAGTLSIAALGVSMPLIMIVSAFGTLVGMGGAAMATIRMGEEKLDTARRIMANCLPLLLGFSLLLTAVCQFFCRDLLLLIGATENTIAYAVEYFSIYAWGTFPVLLVLGMNSFISTQGFATTSMLTVLIGAVCNIVLDPVLIYGLHMGVKGAAVATVFSQTVSAVWVLLFLCGKKTKLRLCLRDMRPRWALIAPVLALGSSPFIMNATESLVGIVFNTALREAAPTVAEADVYVGAYSIIASVMQLIVLPLNGLAQSVQPIISYNYGARQFDRVRRAFALFLRCSLVITVTIWAACMLVPALFVRIFNSDPQLVQVTVTSLRQYMLVMGIFGVQIACQQTFVATGHAAISLFLALLRKVILLIPLILVFSRVWGTTGVFTAEPVADALAVTVTALLFWLNRKNVFDAPSAARQEPPPSC